MVELWLGWGFDNILTREHFGKVKKILLKNFLPLPGNIFGNKIFVKIILVKKKFNKHLVKEILVHDGV